MVVTQRKELDGASLCLANCKLSKLIRVLKNENLKVCNFNV